MWLIEKFLLLLIKINKLWKSTASNPQLAISKTVSTNTITKMGILDFIFGKTIKINDSFFGEMRYFEFKNEPEKNYFECKRHFKPIDKEIEIGIEGNVNGPTEKQKVFFEQIESDYEKIISTIKPMIENEFQNWKKDFKISDFRNEFKAVYLYLPRCEDEMKVWEIGFETEHDSNHTILMTMNDLKATEILVDG